jgi:divalent metal cation (Fe/Co/Zn/Cd) transporter
MNKMSNKILVGALIAMAVIALPASAEVSAQLTAAANTFKTDFLASSAAIGTVMLGAAFGAIIWQWLKAAVFS